MYKSHAFYRILAHSAGILQRDAASSYGTVVVK